MIVEGFGIGFKSLLFQNLDERRGFVIFFGWLTSIILGMTFKTLPFITWNKVYHKRAALGKTPNPKDLFDAFVFKNMSVTYLIGFLVFAMGIFYMWLPLLKIGSMFLIFTSIFYNFNVIKIISHRAKVS